MRNADGVGGERERCGEEEAPEMRKSRGETKERMREKKEGERSVEESEFGERRERREDRNLRPCSP